MVPPPTGKSGYNLAKSLVLLFPNPLLLFHAFRYHAPRWMEITSAMLW